MRVNKYIPSKMYGFAVDSGGMQVFFHLGDFQSPFPGSFYPPVLGEEVEVDVEPASPHGRAPRARRVIRGQPVVVVQGTVESFDYRTGYGFIVGDDGVSYYLHASEVQFGRLPLRDQRVRFCAGTKDGRFRACHVEVCT